MGYLRSSNRDAFFLLIGEKCFSYFYPLIICVLEPTKKFVEPLLSISHYKSSSFYGYIYAYICMYVHSVIWFGCGFFSSLLYTYKKFLKKFCTYVWKKPEHRIMVSSFCNLANTIRADIKGIAKLGLKLRPPDLKSRVFFWCYFLFMVSLDKLIKNNKVIKNDFHFFGDGLISFRLFICCFCNLHNPIGFLHFWVKQMVAQRCWVVQWCLS